MDYLTLVAILLQTLGFIIAGTVAFVNLKRDVADIRKDTKKIQGIENTLVDVTSFLRDLSTHMKDGNFKVPSSLKKGRSYGKIFYNIKY